MMKNSTFIKSLFLLLCMIAGGIGSAWADETLTVDFESAATSYSDWTFTNMTSQQTGSISAHGGTYYGTTGGKSTAALETKNKIANPVSVTFYVSKQSTNTTSSSWYVRVSTDGNNWNQVATQSATSMSKGNWVEVSQSLTDYKDVYVQIFYSGSTAIRNIDDLTLTYEAEATSPLASIALSGTYPTTFYQGDTFSHEGMTVTATYEDESTKDVTAKAEFTGYNMSDTGDQTVTVSYTEGEVTRTAEYGITISAPATLSSISLSGDYQTVFTEGDTFNHDGLVVTANYSDNTQTVVTDDAEFSIPDMSQVGEQTITVTYNEVSTTYDITINAIPTHNVTWSINGATSSESYKEGAAINFPDNPADVNDKTFVGWVTEAIEGATNEAPTFVTSATMGESDITYYAVFAYADGGGSTEVVDELDYNWAGVTGTSYKGWSNNTATSSAVYAGNSAGSYNSIQLRSSGSNSGIVSTTSGGRVAKVVVEWNSNTTAGRRIDIYGKNTAYSSAEELHNANNQGTKLGTITTDGTELTIEGDYAYIGIRSYNGALYLNKVSITWSTGGGVSYSDYCTTVVAATVARPTITVEENPFMFSTTATITCETEGASIKYSFDGENWNNYEGTLTITATTTLYAKAVKNENESTIASVTITKNLAEPTVTIDAEGITNTNVFDGTAAGSLAASVTYNDAAVEGAEVTWSGDNDDVATINAETGAVTLVGAGTVTFTATYAGNSDYAEKTATYEMTVTNTDPNAPGTQNNPYTVAEAITFIGTLGSATSATEVYVSGIISQVDSYNSKYGSITYWISDDGTTDDQMEVYSGLNIDGEQFSAKEDLQVGDIVTVKGYVKMYNTTPEFTQNNELVSLVRVEKPVAPTFSVAEGTYTEAQSVELSTTTEGATIYYTLDGTEPTAESTEYTSAIEITETTTVKAIAIKDDVASDVATATYTIDLTPSITVAETTINASAEGKVGTITVTYNNITEVESEVFFCDADGNEATYDWVYAEINGENNIEYVIDANASTETRTAYMKVYALDDNAEDVYSELITITQAGIVVDWATLPFEYNDGRAYLPTGLTESGLGTDYNGSTAPNTRLKFDNTSDELVLKINEAATVLTFNMKGNGFSGGTFKVQTSANGTDYDDLETYQELSESQEKFLLDEDVRYIKWIYTEKKSGNVGLGNIKVEKRMGDATVTLAAACNDGEGNYYGTYSNATGFIVPEGLTVSEIGIDSENKLDVQEYATGDIVPANTGVMVSSTEDGAHNIVLSTGGESVLGSSNRLRATGDSEKTATAMNDEDSDCVFYRLTMHNGSDLGFWWGAENGAAFSVAANKAYLAVPETVGARIQGFSFDDGIVTGIANMNREAMINNGSVYNMKGQRVAQPAKGLYIQNGKKVVVK